MCSWHVILCCVHVLVCSHIYIYIYICIRVYIQSGAVVISRRIPGIPRWYLMVNGVLFFKILFYHLSSSLSLSLALSLSLFFSFGRTNVSKNHTASRTQKRTVRVIPYTRVITLYLYSIVLAQLHSSWTISCSVLRAFEIRGTFYCFVSCTILFLDRCIDFGFFFDKFSRSCKQWHARWNRNRRASKSQT